MSIPIHAHHAHVFPKEIREDGTIDVLLSTLDACGIETAVAFAPFHEFFTGRAFEPNEWLANAIQQQPRLRGFGVVNMQAPDLKAQVRHIASLGFKGIKMHPAFQKFKIDGEAAFEVYREAEALCLFLSFHTGVHWHRIRDYNMLLFDEVAFNFPKLRFSMEHLGGYCFFKEGLAVMLNNQRKSQEPRLYAGLTSIFDPEINHAWYLGQEGMKTILWQTGENTGIFGLDFPYNGVDSINLAIRSIMEMDIDDSIKAKLLGGNLRRALDF